jgi:hypothetical protein
MPSDLLAGGPARLGTTIDGRAKTAARDVAGADIPFFWKVGAASAFHRETEAEAARIDLHPEEVETFAARSGDYESCPAITQEGLDLGIGLLARLPGSQCRGFTFPDPRASGTCDLEGRVLSSATRMPFAFTTILGDPDVEDSRKFTSLPRSRQDHTITSKVSAMFAFNIDHGNPCKGRLWRASLA